MTTFSLCMIVKNEEKVLARCLDSLADLMDEIIIVDTGSTDRTKEIASRYTDKIYDFTWIDDFSAARNFADSKAVMEYIYTADADELVDPDNHRKLQQLKEVLLPEVEIVQMYYCNDLGDYNTTGNFEKELRPKLYRRQREFTWIDPIHETLRLDPVVFDSEIEILHRPQSRHGSRDLAALQRLHGQGIVLSPKAASYVRYGAFYCRGGSGFSGGRGDLSGIRRTAVPQRSGGYGGGLRAGAYLPAQGGRASFYDIQSQGGCHGRLCRAVL